MVSNEFLHPLYLAFVLGHGLVVHAVFQQMLLAVMNLSAVLQLEGAEGLQGPQQNLPETTSVINAFIFLSILSAPAGEITRTRKRY